jgi:hypothetical protein
MNTSHTQMDTKTCKQCSAEKSLNDFYANAKAKGGYGQVCKQCIISNTVAWKRANPEKARGYVRKWNKAHPSKLRTATDQWCDRNPERVKKASEAWNKAHPAQNNARNSRHRAGKLQATPAWADWGLIDATYTMATAMTRLTGVKYHVDHIVPLRSKLVCGLHVGCNLQLLPAKENTSKGNRHWPDMP